MWVIKLGGSWFSNPKLKLLFHLLEKHKKLPIVFIVGGGIFADAVRKSQKYMGFGDKLANKLAILATENYARSIQDVIPFVKLTPNYSELNRNNLKIWLPSKSLLKSKKFEKNWESTSDSIACWLANKIRCKNILFIKQMLENKKVFEHIFKHI